MKDILELRSEFIDRFGDAGLFDEFYAILVKKVQEKWPEIERKIVEAHDGGGAKEPKTTYADKMILGEEGKAIAEKAAKLITRDYSEALKKLEEE